ncbi:hypothetical protein P152DRAFT_265434 [Eremomyces bilateralis CBS 781.70]|uniref:Zn(2)-C6 fungal-type domain-containing protein n=1 Tax=Eremomyces bilateralis CBS 781.70 TaxID=1392243 RepID=A0A6G1G8N2_9PEZI|nr:uncharacterized protein P152DRAFT_265434 [Eremomyces bilateralis CBS 781.70]KAF1814250.1 hypothetical protein P152DRAFT_265434 [Eremomyces bilateralis CBS 781.70]
MADETPRHDEDRQQDEKKEMMPPQEEPPAGAPHVQQTPTEPLPQPKQEPGTESQNQIAPPHPHHYSSISSPPNITLPSINLPPIRTMDGQQPLPPHPNPPSLQSSVSPSPPSHVSNYFTQAGNHMTLLGHSSHSHYDGSHHLRYPLPHQEGMEQRMMSDGRHKKEIKRRTKTGCLTCRKRRIKCDEAHPFCNNCKKSKRDCLGYDPMFKSTIPANLQPAHPSNSHHTQAGAQSASPPAAQHYYPSAHPPQQPGPQPVKPIGHIGEPLGDPTFISTMPTLPAYHSNKSPLITADYKPPKRITIDDLYHVGGWSPTSPPVANLGYNIPESSIAEIKLLYTNDYAPGLDAMLETTWYTTKGWSRLITNRPLLTLFAHYIDRWRKVPQSDYDGMQTIRSLGMQLVWKLFCMIRPFQSYAPATQPHTNGTLPPVSNIDPDNHPADTLQLKELLPRLEVLEHLLTGQQLRDNPISLADYPPHLPELKSWEIEFWRLVGLFLTLRASDSNLEESKRVESALKSVRLILGLKENRDVIYSILVTRHFGPRVPGFPRMEMPDPIRKLRSPDQPNQEVPMLEDGTEMRLWVAKDFIEKEASGGSTNEVAMRVSDFVRRSWHILHEEP